MTIPARPKIYHITHLRNIEQLASSGYLWSDAKRLELGLDCRVVGMAEIKRRRLEEIEVKCHPGTTVGQYAPFYFCPRSIMLYLLYRGNHPDVDYTEGQRPIVHLQADLRATIQWADNHGIQWAFSDRNAGAYLAGFFNTWEQLDRLNWDAITATDFRDMLVKEGKQAEFLMFEAFPWTLVEKVGVIDRRIASQAASALADADYEPPIYVERGWYY
jgi:hypothetical protein